MCGYEYWNHGRESTNNSERLVNLPRAPVRVGVVGTAGRSEDGKKMTSELFKRMIDKTVDVITNVFKLDIGRVRLVSGGAAWAGEYTYNCVHYMQ